MRIVVKDELGENTQVAIFWLQAKIDRNPKMRCSQDVLGLDERE